MLHALTAEYLSLEVGAVGGQRLVCDLALSGK